jgi:hypothetical protein
MAGSKDWRLYVTNDGATFAINMDTSNAIALGLAEAPVGTRTLPRGITTRLAVFRSQDGVYTRRIPVGTLAVANGLSPTFNLDTSAGSKIFNLVTVIGEKEKRSQPNTGQLV